MSTDPQRTYVSDLERIDTIERECSYIRLGCYPEVGPGWMPLVEAMLRAMDEAAARGLLTVHVLDLKEKYGSLRIMSTVEVLPGADDEAARQASAVIDALEGMAGEKSQTICTRCGAPGRMSTRGWIEPLCETHWPAPFGN